MRHNERVHPVMAQTMVHQLLAQAAARGDAPALWRKVGRDWLPTSWREYAQRVQWAALALQSLGVRRGSSVAVMAFNREEWLVSDLAAMATGAMPVGLYTTASDEQLQFILGHAEVEVAIVEHTGFAERVLAMRAALPRLRHVVVMQGTATGALSWAEFLKLGLQGDAAQFHRQLAQVQPTDVASLIYTSGTTGHPRGVMLSHHNIGWATVQLTTCAHIREGEFLVSYLPLSHIAEQICSIYGPLLLGIQVYFAESLERVREAIKDVRPTVFFGVPRVWEKFKAAAEAAIAQQSPRRQRLIAWARRVSTAYHTAALNHEQQSVVLEAEYQLAQRLVFSKLKARIGFDRCWLFATSAAPISRDVLDFFASIDLVLREVYGQSEVSGPTSVNSETATRLGTLGRPMPGVDLRIADDGEILVRGGNVCLGYFKDPTATAELLQNGWLHSGDLGALDAEGYLTITGRKKELIVTSGGKKTAPVSLENLLAPLGPFGHVMVVGDERHYLTALFTLDPERVPRFAQAKGWPATPAALASHAPFLSWLREQIDGEVHPRVARFEQIRRFTVLPHEFSIAGGELTSTLKLRREHTAAKYASQINAMYEG